MLVIAREEEEEHWSLRFFCVFVLTAANGNQKSVGIAVLLPISTSSMSSIFVYFLLPLILFPLLFPLLCSTSSHTLYLTQETGMKNHGIIRWVKNYGIRKWDWRIVVAGASCKASWSRPWAFWWDLSGTFCGRGHWRAWWAHWWTCRERHPNRCPWSWTSWTFSSLAASSQHQLPHLPANAINARTHQKRTKKGTKREWWWFCEYEWGYAHHGWKMKSAPKPFLGWGWWCKVLLPAARILQSKKKAGRVSEEGEQELGKEREKRAALWEKRIAFYFFVLKIKCYSTLYLPYTNPP